MSDPASVAPAPPSPPSTSVWEDFIDIFYAPASVFERRRGRSPWPILLVLTLALTALFFVWQRAFGPLLDLEMQRAAMQTAQENAQLGPEQLEQMRSVGRIFGLIGFAVAFPIGVVIASFVTWVLARMSGAAAGFALVAMVVTYAQIVRIPQYVLALLQAPFVDVDRLDSIHDVGFSLARFMDQPDASAALLNLAARVDIFTLWATALIAIGLRVAAGLPRARAWTVAALVWLLAALPQVVGGLVRG